MSKVHEIVADQILEALEQGTIPWQRPWNVRGAYNVVSGKGYRGINAMLLNLHPFGPGFMTWKQMEKEGGHLEKGTRSVLITYYGNYKKKGADENDPGSWILRYYKVFPVSKISGLPEKYYEAGTDNPEIPSVEDFVAGTKCPILYGGTSCYHKTGTIHMVPLDQFHDTESFYATLFHEMIHWSKTNEECTRKLSYAEEELVAEIGASMLCHHFGFDRTIENTAAYCESWAGRISESKSTLIFRASSASQRAVDFLLASMVE